MYENKSGVWYVGALIGRAIRLYKLIFVIYAAVMKTPEVGTFTELCVYRFEKNPEFEATCLNYQQSLEMCELSMQLLSPYATILPPFSVLFVWYIPKMGIFGLESAPEEPAAAAPADEPLSTSKP